MNDPDFPQLGEVDRHEVDVARVVGDKNAENEVKRTKCSHCWKRSVQCICGALKDIHEQIGGCFGKQRFQFLIFMSKEEWLCAGNSGRLLSHIFPAETSYFVRGVRADAERLRNAVRAGGGAKNACVLFPGPHAIHVKEWVAAAAAAAAAQPPHPGGNHHEEEKIPPYLSVILVDGTWGQAVRMARYLNKVLLPTVKQVSLTLEGDLRVSVFHRKQSQDGRICTAEALAMFVSEVLDTFSCDGSAFASSCSAGITEAIKVNNRALAPKKDIAWKGTGGSPLWYFGERVSEL